MSLSDILTVNSNTYDNWKQFTMKTLNCQNIIGFTGAGSTGPTGPTGSRGPTGSNGTNGTSGPTGSTGPGAPSSGLISWTPIISDGATPMGLNLGSTVCRYMTVGNILYFCAHIDISDNQGDLGNLQITTPPIPPSSIFNGAGLIGATSQFTNITHTLFLSIEAGNPVMLVYDGNNVSPYDSSNVITGSGPCTIEFSGFYFI